MDKVILTLKNFGAFRDAFCEFKGKLPTYFKEDKKSKTWDFQEHLIFKRFDSFVDRLMIIKEFFRTAQQFLKLEKVEMGGIRGIKHYLQRTAIQGHPTAITAITKQYQVGASQNTKGPHVFRKHFEEIEIETGMV